MNKNISNLMVNKDITIKLALEKLDYEAKGFLAVIDKSDVLVGTITDGDIRRWILKNGDLTELVDKVMNINPISIRCGEESIAKEVMMKNSIKALPVLNDKNKIVDIIFYEDEFIKRTKKNSLKSIPVVIMAGGLGTRLYPYTKILPKPLIPIGDTPILERIINKFVDFGVEEFYLTVNYKKNMIKSYFNELDKEYSVSYVEEDKPLGTGGSLYLLKSEIKDTFFVSNCDILIECDYESIYKYHKERGNKVTVIASVKNFTIPYGVFSLNDKGNIDKVQEKPEFSFLINTGMYILEPEVISDIPEGEFYNLPDILQKYIDNGERIGLYPISEQSWMDMGQISEMKEMVEKIEEKEKNND
ncbi:nucleotidyltransferase family protein [Clostridium sartagoforme]|uniref:nucleotidyltransferase family protein n=1 Tax=Clostridium sartagoforme TaxID=84031 RepID=UPI0031DB73EB